MATKTIKSTARKLYIQFGFRFYGDDGEPSWSMSTQIKDENGRLTGRWTSESGGDCGELNREAAAELWDKGKYYIEDYGGDDFHFTLTEKDKEKWYEKARKILDKK